MLEGAENKCQQYFPILNKKTVLLILQTNPDLHPKYREGHEL
jgi:hypothetical protein